MPGVEVELIDAVRAMLRLPQFHFPLVAAQREYRQHYYGLSSAGLLEDLYYDTFWNFLAQYRPDVRLDTGRGAASADWTTASRAVQ